MKKITTSLVLLFALSFGLQAQYYYNTYNPAGTNPGGLNTDPEQPLGFTPGYTTVIPANTTTLTWSSNQTIPFPFNFNGNPVTQYKVSTSGVLTFTTSATTVPPFNNTALPSASVPDASIMIWGLQQLAGNDAVGSKTFGTAPNRQHWIEFLSYSAPGASGSQWTYWGIVLEETTNNIYIVDKRTFNTPLSLTIGIKIDNITSTVIPTAPNTPSFVTNGGNASDPSDNVYYEFIQGTRPADDIKLETINTPSSAVSGSSVTLTGSIQNAGSVVQDSVLVNWSTDNGVTVNTSLLTGLSLAPLASTNFSHTVNWIPANPGNFTNMKVWTSLPAPKVDGNNTNDTLSASIFVNLGNSVQRKVLFEEFTTAVCQFCPDGAVVADQLLAQNQNVIGVGVHACFGTDAMTTSEASIICSTLGSNSAPTGMVDRTVYPGDATAAFSRSLWISRANARAMEGSPVGITVTGAPHPSGTYATVDISVSFVDYPEPGNINVSLIVVEDSVVGPNNSGYNQVNAYNNTAGHPYQGAGNPIVGFVHRHVLRDVLPATFGDPNVIPSNISLNTPYTKQIFVPYNNWDVNQMSVIAVVSYAGPGIENYQVLNAEEVKINELSTGFEETSGLFGEVSVYPNPSEDLTYLNYKLKENANVQMEVYDVRGKLVLAENFGQKVRGKQQATIPVSQLENGFYFVNLKAGSQQITRKIAVMH